MLSTKLVTVSFLPDGALKLLTDDPSKEFIILSISLSKVIYVSITNPLLSISILMESIFLLFVVVAKQTFILPCETSKGITLFFFAISIEI